MKQIPTYCEALEMRARNDGGPGSGPQGGNHADVPNPRYPKKLPFDHDLKATRERVVPASEYSRLVAAAQAHGLTAEHAHSALAHGNFTVHPDAKVIGGSAARRAWHI